MMTMAHRKDLMTVQFNNPGIKIIIHQRTKSLKDFDSFIGFIALKQTTTSRSKTLFHSSELKQLNKDSSEIELEK